jgi:hypothetical protein
VNLKAVGRRDAKKTAHDLRCSCRRRPLLALYGVDGNGKLYIEIKVYKQRLKYGHVIVTLKDGEVKLFCRECHRWYVVTVTADTTAELREIVSPIPEDASDTEIP